MNPALFASATYVGSHIIHMWNAIELNPAQFLGLGPCTLNTATGPVSYPVCSTTGNVNQRRILNLYNPQANLGYVTQYDDGFTQGYNGMLLDLRWRRSQNLNVNLNYTWSHCIGPLTINVLNPGQNYVHQVNQNAGPANRDFDLSNCAGDRRQIFNSTVVAKTPKFSNGALRVAASDWSFSTIFIARSGQPLNVLIGTDQALNGFSGNASGTQRPNQVLADPYGDRNSLTNYLNINAFALPAAGTYGNVGYDGVVGPGYWDWSEAVARQFKIGEGRSIEFRAEAFNVTNTMRRGNPATTFTTPNTFGRITSSTNGPRIMQFALKYVF